MAPARTLRPKQEVTPEVIFAAAPPPAIIAAPMGPPMLVHMTATPPTMRAPAAMYSQLFDTQSVAALPRAPLLESR